MKRFMFCEERKGIVIKFGRPTKYFFMVVAP